jgi:hypothetical protein
MADSRTLARSLRPLCDPAPHASGESIYLTKIFRRDSQNRKATALSLLPGL